MFRHFTPQRLLSVLALMVLATAWRLPSVHASYGTCPGPEPRGDEPLYSDVSGGMSRSVSKSFGDSTIGSDVYSYVSSRFNADSRVPSQLCPSGYYLRKRQGSASMTSSAYGKIFGSRFKAIGVAASAVVNDVSNHSDLSVYLGNDEIFTDSDPKLVAHTVGHFITFFSRSWVFEIYYVPVTVTVDVGAGIEIGMTVESSWYARVAGHARAWLQGSGSAGPGIPCVRAFLENVLQIANTTLAGEVSASYSCARARVSLIYEALRVKLNACVELCPFGKACYTIAEWATSKETLNLLSYEHCLGGSSSFDFPDIGDYIPTVPVTK